MEALKRYRKRMGSAPKGGTDSFIEMALNKVNIRKYVSGETSADMSAVLIFKDKEGPDAGILYTYADDGLSVGDSIVKKGSRKEDDVNYLLVEQVKRVDTSVVIKVFNVLETNVSAKSKNKPKDMPCYLQSNIRRNIRTTESAGIAMELNQAVLVAPESYGIKLDETLRIRNFVNVEGSYSTWLVEGIDNISTPDINYVHLKRVLDEKTDTSGKTLEDDSSIKAHSALELKTHNGYIETTPAATILERSATRVVIQIPGNSKTLQVKVKDENNKIITDEYVIRR